MWRSCLSFICTEPKIWHFFFNRLLCSNLFTPSRRDIFHKNNSLLHCVSYILWMFEMVMFVHFSSLNNGMDWILVSPHIQHSQYLWETLEGSITSISPHCFLVALQFECVKATNTLLHVYILYILKQNKSQLPLMHTVDGRTSDGTEGLKWDREMIIHMAFHVHLL